MSHPSPTSSATNEPSPRKVEKARRIGYGAKGVLYGLLGILAASSAFGAGAQSKGFKDAIVWVASQPFGTVLLVALLLGLAAYSLYRLGCALFDLENVGTGGKGIGRRIGYGASGLAYGSLAVFCGSLIWSGGSGSSSKTEMVAHLLDSTWGRILLGLIALGLLAAGIAQLAEALTGKYRDKFAWSKLPSGTRKFVAYSAKFGLISRAVVFAVLAYLLGLAVYTKNASKAGGMEEAFSWLGAGGSSSWLFALVAIGFIAYAVFAFAIAYCGKYRFR